MKKVFLFCLLCMLMLPILTGCIALPAEAPGMMPPAVIIREEVRPFRTMTVTRGDVRLSSSPFAQMNALAEATVSFSVGGIPIYAVYVSEGDMVQEGDLIASLYIEGLTEGIEDLARTSSALTLQLAHVQQQHALALRLAEESGNPVDDSRFQNAVSDISRELEVINWHLDILLEEDAVRHIRAPISGVITQAIRNPQQDEDIAFVPSVLSSAGSRVATIADLSRPSFVVRTAEDVRNMSIGDQYYMSIGDNMFLMEVVDPEEHNLHRRPEWTVAAFLIFADPDAAVIAAGSGRVYMIFDEVFDVVSIPTRYLRQAGTRNFVYVYEEGLRVARDVNIGLVGDFMVEIVSGLTEGEVIIQ